MAPSIDPGPHFVGLVGNRGAVIVEPEAEEPGAAVGVGIEAVGHVAGLGMKALVGEV